MYSIWAFVLRFGIEIHLTSAWASVDIGRDGLSANFVQESPPPISIYEKYLPARPKNWHMVSIGWDPIDGYDIFIRE